MNRFSIAEIERNALRAGYGEEMVVDAELILELISDWRGQDEAIKALETKVADLEEDKACLKELADDYYHQTRRCTCE